MKLNKEQIAFLVILLILGWIGWSQLSGTGDGRPPRRSARGGGDVADLAELQARPAELFGVDEASWSAVGRNVYRAPSEFSSLPPVPLPPPPRPDLPLADPPPVPGPDVYNRADRVRPLVAVEGVSLPPREDSGLDEVFAEDEELPEEGGEEAVVEESEPVVQEEPTGPVPRSEKRLRSLRDRLARRAIDRVKEQQEEVVEEAAREEMRAGLDRVLWANGEIWYGEVTNDREKRPGQAGLDRYEIKLRIDAIRGDADLDAQARDAALKERDLEVEFRRWKDGKLERKQKLPTVSIRAVEFGDTPINVFELGRRRLDPADLEGHLELVRGLVAAGEPRLAKRHLLRLRETGHRSRELYVALADAAARDFDHDTRVLALSEGLEAFPRDADLLTLRGRFQSQLGLDALATESFREALAIDDRLPRPNAALGRHLLDRGAPLRSTPREALAHLQRALEGRIEIAADRRRVQFDLGRALLRLGRTVEARRVFTDLVAAAPEEVEPLVGLGATLFLEGDLAGARERLEAALDLDPLEGRAWFDLGLVALAEEKWEEARDRLGDAGEADPLLAARASAALGYLYERIGAPLDAQSAYAAAYEADPSDPEVVALHGRGFALAGDHERAHEHYGRALAAMPGHPELLARLAETSFRLERFDDALRYVAAAAEAGGRSHGLDLLEAWTLLELGRFDQAKAVLDRAKAAEDSREVELGQAYFYYRQGNHEEALKRLRAVEKRIEDREESAVADYVRVWAFEIEENLAKQVWTDHFDRSGAGGDLLRGWETHAPGSGIQVVLQDGRVALRGRQRQSASASCLFQRRQSKEFVSFEAAIEVEAEAPVTVGAAILTFRKNTGNENALVDKDTGGIAFSGLIVGKTAEGRLAYRIIERYEPGPWVAIGDGRWPLGPEGTPASVSVGFSADRRKSGHFDILVGGAPVVRDVEVKGLQRGGREVQLWVFTQAEIDKRVDVKVDDVRIVTRKEDR